MENQNNELSQEKATPSEAASAPQYNVIGELEKSGNAILVKVFKKIDDVCLTLADSLKADAQRTVNDELNKFLESFKKAVEK